MRRGDAALTLKVGLLLPVPLCVSLLSLSSSTCDTVTRNVPTDREKLCLGINVNDQKNDSSYYGKVQLHGNSTKYIQVTVG